MSPVPCFDDRTALAFASGELDDAARTAILAHIETCGDCHALIEHVLDAGPEPTPVEELPRVPSPYRIEALIAEGGMGRIYRAFDTELQRTVAIKVPRSSAPGLLRRFEREVAITARLQHPGIVAVHGAGQLADGTPFYVMRFVEGTSLEAAVDRAGDVARRLELLPQLIAVAETIAYVHGEQVAHRDLKPNNVLLGRFGETMVIDWGLAKRLHDDARPSIDDINSLARHPDGPLALDDTDPPSGATTRAGDVLGTPAFMAPEQAAGQPVDVRADVYALGVMLSFLVTGQIRRVDDDPAWTGEAAALAPIYRRATAPDRTARYPDAGAMATALRAARGGAVPPRRHRRIALAIGAMAATVLATLLIRAGIAPSPSRSAPSARLEWLDVARNDLVSIALSPSGQRLGYAGIDRIEVRELASGRTWTRLGWTSWPRIIVFESETSVTYGGMEGPRSPVMHLRWNLDDDQVDTVATMPAKEYAWGGALADATLYMSLDPVQPVLHPAHAPPKRLGLGRYAIESVSIAPDRRAFAFVDRVDRTDAMIRVVDARGDRIVDSPVHRDVTALTWSGPDTLMYATGSAGIATLWQVPVANLAAPRRLLEHAGAEQWIGAIATQGSRTLISVASSTQEARWLTAETGRIQRLPETDAAAVLGWVDDASLLTWNRSTSAIERRGLDDATLPAVTPARFSGDPANATRAGDLIIIARRNALGREVVALDLTTGAVRWQSGPGALWFVRCAGDRTPPCVAGARTSTGLTELRQIDPVTGALGPVLVAGGNIADAAVDLRGTTLAWIVNNWQVRTRAFDGAGEGASFPSHYSSAHSLAFIADGAELVVGGGPDGRGIYRVSRESRTRLSDAGQEILSLVRASPDAARVSYRARSLTSRLAEVHLAR